MPRNSVTRTPRRQCGVALPDDLKLGTVLLAGIQGRGLLSRVGEWLPLSRRAGPGTGSLFAFALAALAAGRRWGIWPFTLAFGAAPNRFVAPLLGLRSLPTASSMSRGLGQLEHDEVRGFMDRLLTADPGTWAVLASPHVRHRDAHGCGWHVLDFDTTIEAFPQRGLPEDAPRSQAAARHTGAGATTTASNRSVRYPRPDRPS